MRRNSRLQEKVEDFAMLPINQAHNVSCVGDENVVRVEVWVAERRPVEEGFFGNQSIDNLQVHFEILVVLLGI